jgi:hypothetical protein
MKEKPRPRPKSARKLTLHRETLHALAPSDLERVLAGATSACKSGVTCCQPNCTGGC